MIRKFLIVGLTLVAVASGTIGVLSGSGRARWRQTLWSSGEFATVGAWRVSIRWGTSGTVLLDYSDWLDSNAAPYKKKRSGTGWLYARSAFVTERQGLYARTSLLIVSFYIPLLLALLCFAYPAINLIRGPLRRFRRRKRSLCVTCGYDLRGSPEGCPECATEIKSP